MATWEEKVAARKAQRLKDAEEAENAMKAMEEELEDKHGLFVSIAKLWIKWSRLSARLFFRAGNVAQPSTAVSLDETYAESVFEISPNIWNETISGLVHGLKLDAEAEGILKSFYQPLKGASPLIQGFALVSMYISVMQYIMGTGMGKMVQSLGVKFRPGLPGAGEVMGARALTPELDQQLWGVLRRNGYGEEDIKLMLASTYIRLNESTIRNLFYREGRSVDWASKELTKIGYTPERVKEIMLSWPELPSVQDLIYMVGREAFEPEVQRMFGLDSPAPGLYLEHAAKIGYPQFWAQKMWEAHWEHPSLNQVLDMFHRDLLDWKQVYEYMTIVELPPFWREKIKEAAYNVITRVDARRMYGVGTINEQELFDTYRHMGYSPEDAARLTDFSIKYESGADRDVAKEDILRAYGYKDIDRPTAQAWLEQIGYQSTVADFYLSQKDLETDRTKTTKSITLIRDKYTGNLIEKPEAQAKLSTLGLTPQAIAEQLESWDIARAKNTKLPSKTDLDKFLRASIIDKGTYRTEMSKLGYAEKYTNWYLEAIQKGLAANESETD
jgi:hypothetical protein